MGQLAVEEVDLEIFSYFPAEIEREIFLYAASDGRSVALNIGLLAKRIYHW